MGEYLLLGELGNSGDYETIGFKEAKNLHLAKKDFIGRFGYLATPKRITRVIVVKISGRVKKLERVV